MKTNGIKVALLTTCLATCSGLFGQTTLKVDLSDSIRSVTHCASGALYGITSDLPTDVTNMIAPLKGNVYVQPAISGKGHQQPIGDAFDVAKRLQGTTGKVQIRLADILPGWPYNWPGMDSWKKQVSEIITKKKNSGLNNFDGYEIWNEPYGTWKDSNGDFHSFLWKNTYDLIRQQDPGAKIIGPSLAFYSSSRMEAFLKYCKENNCLPDVICWHQWGSGGFIDALDNLHSLEKKYGIPDLPISINEYCAGSDAANQKYEGCPGYSVPFIAKFERNKVQSAMISWWFTGLPGRLGSLLTKNNEKGGGWWLYKWYGDMTGYMARVTPPKDKSDGVDGFVAVDRKKKYVSLVLGGNTTGDVNVVFDRVPDFLGGKVRAKIERVTWVDKDTPVSGTNLISESDVTINGTTLTIPVKLESNLYGYRVYLTPLDVPLIPFNKIAGSIPGKIEAEDFDFAGQGFSYYDNDEENRGKEYRKDEGVDIVTGGSGYAIGYTEKGEWMKYTVNVEETAEYDVTTSVSSDAEKDGFILYVDDKAVGNGFSIPQTGDGWDIYEEVKVGRVTMTKGEHLLKLEIVGSYANIDWIKFTPYVPTGIETVESNNSDEVNAQYFDISGQPAKQSNLQKGKIYIKVTPDKTTKIIK
ncbi:MAG: carbohydrate-binding protein [Paludibacteraceae bacterium]|nr:carbohydrate-binding protein [Paludibacteraceae bacterium]